MLRRNFKLALQDCLQPGAVLEGWEFPPGNFSNILPAVSSLSVVLLYIYFCSDSSFRFQCGSSGQIAVEGGNPAFAEVGAVASCAKGGDGTKEEMGVEQRKRDQSRAASCFLGDFHVIQFWAHVLVSWPCHKLTFATWVGDTLTQ